MNLKHPAMASATEVLDTKTGAPDPDSVHLHGKHCHQQPAYIIRGSWAHAQRWEEM